MVCDICGKEASNAAGLAAHKRSHKPEPVVETESFKETSRNGDFALATAGNIAIVTDLTGKPVSKPMPVDEATIVFQRFSNSRR